MYQAMKKVKIRSNESTS